MLNKAGRAATGIRRAYVDTPAGQMHYRVAGDSTATPLLLIHQSPSSSAMWEPVLPLMAALGYRALAVDLLGHGNSAPTSGAPTLRDFVDGVWAMVDALALPPSAIVGHHSGAAVAIVMATDRPEWVSALALWGVPVLVDDLRAQLAAEGPLDWEHAQDWLGPRWARRRSASRDGGTAAITRRFLLELLQAAPNTNELHNAVALTPVEPLLPHVRQPLLSLCGELDVLWNTAERAAHMAPHGQFAPIHGASVDVVDENTDTFVEIVDRFLRAHTAQPRRDQA